MVDTIDRHLFDDEYVILKFNHTSCVCLSCYLQKELVSIVGSYCTLSLKSLVATLHLHFWLIMDLVDLFQRFCTFRRVVKVLPESDQRGIYMLSSCHAIGSLHAS